MRALSAEVSQKISRAAVQAGAKVIKDLAVSKAPVAKEPYVVRKNKADKHGVLVQPGNIPKNIVTKRVKDSRMTAETVIAIRGKRKDGYASRIASLKEFGTVKMPAEPFMRPAFDEGGRKAVDAVKNRLTTRIAKAVRDNAKKAK